MNRRIKFLIAMFGYAVVAAALWDFSTRLQQIASFFMAGGIFVMGMVIPLWVSAIGESDGDTSQRWGCTTFLIYSIAGVAIVWVTGYTFEETEWPHRQGAWAQLPPAPETLVALPLGATYEGPPGIRQEFYGRTRRNTYYAYTCNEKDICEWQSVAKLPATATLDPYCSVGPGQTEPYPRTEAPPSKGKVIDERIKLVCYLGYIQTNYQLLDDGSVWRWEKNNLYDFGIPYIVSLMLGGGYGIILWVFRNRPFWDRRPRREVAV